MTTDPLAATTRVFVIGATGTIGRATVAALVEAGHRVTCLVRPLSHGKTLPPELAGAEVRFGDATNTQSLARDGFAGETFGVLISCLASRTGTTADAWAVDHRAHVEALKVARDHGVRHMILLSAICVQKPRLPFQHAKLAFEAELMASGITWSIVRPTAYFKSLSGQVARVKAGKPYLVFGDGQLTACKPISDRDLGRYIASCIDDPARHNRILPIGGPGPAQTPREQGEALFALLGQPARISQAPVALISTIAGVLGAVSKVVPALRSKAELARIGHYYATESMLVWNADTGRYDADATPEFGTDTLIDYHARLIRGEVQLERTEQSVF